MTLIKLLKESAEKNRSKVALKFQDKYWNFEELYDTIIKIAASFEDRGIKKGDKVALFLKNSPEFIWSVFALSAIGAEVVPLNFYLKYDEILYVAENCGLSAVITQLAFLETIKEVQKKYKGLRKIWVTDSTEKSEDIIEAFGTLLNCNSSPDRHSREKRENPDIDAEDTVLILYTSGTTGKSKGVMLTHKNLISNATAAIEALEINNKDNFICILPLFHVFAWTANVLVPLSLGCPILIVESIRPPQLWLKKLAKENITVFAAVPQIYALLSQGAHGLRKWILRFLFRTVRLCISGAAPLPKEVAENFEKKIRVCLLEGYGLTETSPVTTVNSLKYKKLGTVGKVIPGVRVKIIDETEKELGTGQEGEICIQGPNVMKGYYGLPEETKNSFTQDGWFRTGDIGALDSEGFLTILDRIKDMIIVKGLKVFSAQVEDVLRSHPKVLEAAVIGIPTANGDEFVKAYVVLKENETFDKMELRKHCQKLLPPYKQPRNIEIIKELPKNALQKVLKRELRESAMGKEHEKK